MYATTFKRLQPRYDPRHIEAYVRLEYSTLDGCSIEVLRREAAIAAMCIDTVGPIEAEACAVSVMGPRPAAA